MNKLAGYHERNAGDAGVGAAALFLVAVARRSPIEPFVGRAFNGEVTERIGAFDVGQHANLHRLNVRS
jgi:hypothetical protein